ncbi:MAG TPA: hypothetical protein VFT99_22610, partial [Roseiflexaceae bacterium]|nr:hypothetical protein [Roseiflexaceae bacterium]
VGAVVAVIPPAQALVGRVLALVQAMLALAPASEPASVVHPLSLALAWAMLARASVLASVQLVAALVALLPAQSQAWQTPSLACLAWAFRGLAQVSAQGQ